MHEVCPIINRYDQLKSIFLMPRSSKHSLKIHMASQSCNKYEQITLFHLLSINYRDTLPDVSVDTKRYLAVQGSS